MTTNKDQKRVIRARMKKTGEAYTAARAIILRRGKRGSPNTDEAGAAVNPLWAAPPGMSDEAVTAKTGRGWAAWVEVLDATNAAQMPHKDIAAYVADHFHVDGWWAQTVTVGYERIRGLRDVGQRRGGLYEASKSGTFAVDVSALYRMFADARRRKGWLRDGWTRVRTATEGKSLRVDWHDGSQVHLYFTAKGPRKSHVAVQHVKLPSKAAVGEAKAFWAGRLEALREQL